MRIVVVLLFTGCLSVGVVACGDNFDRDTLLGTTPADAMPVPDSEILSDEWGEEGSDSFLANESEGGIGVDEEGGLGVDKGAEYTDTTPSDDDTAPSSQCGNGIVESGEVCDGGSASCADVEGANYTGTAFCRSDCAGWDASSCQQTVDHPVYVVDPAKCTGCRRCLPACSFGAIAVVSYKAVIDPEKCTGCGKCAAVCPRGAITKKP